MYGPSPTLNAAGPTALHLLRLSVLTQLMEVQPARETQAALWVVVATGDTTLRVWSHLEEPGAASLWVQASKLVSDNTAAALWLKKF